MRQSADYLLKKINQRLTLMNHKTIPDFENYTITVEGVVTNENTKHIKTHRVGKNGYKTVSLCSCGVSSPKYIHRLLAQAFIPNPLNKRTVNHIDGDKLNNELTNLEWATDSENIQHAYDNSLNHCSTKVISTTMLKNALELVLKGSSLTVVANRLNVSLTQLSVRMKRYVSGVGLVDVYTTELAKQKKSRTDNVGKARRTTSSVLMVCSTTDKLLRVFTTLAEVKEFLHVKSVGPISNVIKGRQRRAYGYKWLRVNNFNDYRKDVRACSKVPYMSKL